MYIFGPIEVRGVTAGRLVILGSEGESLRCKVISNGTVKELACMCEGAFSSVRERTDNGEAFIAIKLTGRDEERTSDEEKLDFLRRLAEHLGKRVEANLDSQERSRS